MTVASENVDSDHVVMFGVFFISYCYFHFPLACQLEQLLFVRTCARLCSCAGCVRLCSCAKGVCLAPPLSSRVAPSLYLLRVSPPLSPAEVAPPLSTYYASLRPYLLLNSPLPFLHISHCPDPLFLSLFFKVSPPHCARRTSPLF